MGVLDTIRVRQEGFPVIKSYYEWYQKFEDAVDFPGKLFLKKLKMVIRNYKNGVILLLPN